MSTTPVRSRVPRWRILPLYLLFLMLVAAAVEVVVRFIILQTSDPAIHLIVRDYGHLGDNRTQRFQAAAYVNYRLTPGFEQSYEDGQTTRHNAQGFRDDEDFQPKAEGAYRIVCIGGSTTYGVAVRDNGDTYPARLKEELKRDPLPQWASTDVYNLGVGGYTTADMLPLLHFYALPLQPDAILLHCAINDVAPRFYDDFQCDYSHFRTLWKEPDASWAARLMYRSEAVLWAGWKLGWIEPLTLQSRTQRPLPPASIALDNLKQNSAECFRSNIEAIIALAKARGVRVWLVTQAYLEHKDFYLPDAEARQLEKGYRQGQAEHNEVMRAVAAEQGVGLIDLDQATPLEREYFADPIHMTPAGNRFKASYIAQVLRREVR